MTKKTRQNEDKIEVVYQYLRDEIIQGRLKPLEPLDQTIIANQLNCSRMPVRQALLKLSLEGLVSYIPNKVTTVTPLSVEDMIEVYTARALLESMLASKGARKCGLSQLIELKKLVEAQRNAVSNRDPVEFLRLDQEFHKILYRASGYLYICTIVDQLRQRASRYLHVYASSQDHLVSSLDEHEEIIKAIEQEDYHLVGELTTSHIEKYKNVLADIILGGK